MSPAVSRFVPAVVFACAKKLYWIKPLMYLKLNLFWSFKRQLLLRDSVKTC